MGGACGTRRHWVNARLAVMAAVAFNQWAAREPNARPSGECATLPAFTRKKKPDSTFLGPPVFFVWPRYHSGTCIEVLIRLWDGSAQVEVLCCVIVYYGVVHANWRGVDWHRNEVSYIHHSLYFYCVHKTRLSHVTLQLPHSLNCVSIITASDYLSLKSMFWI